MPNPNNYGGIFPSSADQLPPPFRQDEAYKLLDCPGGRGSQRWLPGVRLPLVPGTFEFNIEAVSRMYLYCQPIVLTSPQIATLGTIGQNSHPPFFSYQQPTLRNCRYI